MRVQLFNCYCWEPGSGFSNFLTESHPLDFGELATLSEGETCKIVQNGQYRIKVCMEKNGGKVALKAGVNILSPEVTVETTGRMFVSMDDVDVMDMQGGGKILGRARGCFDIEW